MVQDTIRYDSLEHRPLPKWLTDQKEGLTTVQPQKIVMKEDKSLSISFILTVAIIFIVVAVLTIYILRKKKSQPL